MNNNTEKEIWKDVTGWEGVYQVSSLGRVKSLDRVTIYKNGRRRRFPSTILRPGIDSSGYHNVVLYQSSKKQTTRVHRLVATSFISNPGDLPEVNHIDENKLNNNVKNLEWLSCKDNTNHGTGTERRVLKKVKRIAKLDDNGDILEVYNSLIQVEEVEGFSKGNVSKAANGLAKTSYGFKWKYI